MLAGRAVAGVAGVGRVLVAMATELNVALLAELGYAALPDAGPGDLVVAFTCEGDGGDAEGSDSADATESAALAALADSLTPQPGGSITAPGHPHQGRPDQPAPRTTATALGRTSAPITLISTPGLASVAEAMESLEYGASPIIFSDNIPIHHEVRLKEEARRRGLLVMGPDCGTVVLHGTGLAFATIVRPGPISLVAASGTGAQQLMALLDAAGTGIHHCLGVGGRDLTEQVAGRSTLAALTALADDPATELITVVSKPPHPTIAAKIQAHAATLGKPVHFAFVGPNHPTLTESAEHILTALGHQAPQPWPQWAPTATTAAVATTEPMPPSAPMIRGLFSGGTLRAEAEVVLTRAGGQMIDNQRSGGRGAGESRGLQTPPDAADERLGTAAHAHAAAQTARADVHAPENTPRPADEAPATAAATHTDLHDPELSAPESPDAADERLGTAPHAHATAATAAAFAFDLTDFGDDAYTRGRPHPMIDNTLRSRGVAEAAADERVGVVLLDVVLGRGAHADPGAEIAAAIGAARGVRAGLAVVVSLCGAAGDPQGLGRQAGVLAGAGAWVFLSNAEAAGAAARLALGGVAVGGGAFGVR
ncbi:hypothetical protein [Catenulispora acidiphila]|nr:hypothetical protein [Catenulispora acidiphila]